jgi:hypothetical protein
LPLAAVVGCGAHSAIATMSAKAPRVPRTNFDVIPPRESNLIPKRENGSAGADERKQFRSLRAFYSLVSREDLPSVAAKKLHEPSHVTPLAVLLQAQKFTVLSLSATNLTDLYAVPLTLFSALWLPSQNGWVFDAPHEHQ